MTEKYFSLVNVNVIFNIIFFDYVKEWSCLCDIFFRCSGGGGGEGEGMFIRGGRLNKGAFIDGFYLLGGVHPRGRLFKALR